jgi:uncharacterized protein YgiM (DUF1202 family)
MARLLAAALAVAVIVLSALAQAPVLGAAPEKRVALVIGNATYKDSPLKNPANDARLMAGKLRELGFDVIARENATREQMAGAIGAFLGKLDPGAVALVYYAGHGIQSRGRNYLLPVDVTLAAETDLRFQAVDVSTLTEELEQSQARVSMVILDSCRNNPFERRFRGASRGMAAIDAARGGLIAYATAPGSVAADGDGANGPYTEELVKALAIPNLKAEEVFKRVTAGVEERTKGLQTPWVSSSLRGDFIFNLTINVAPPAAAPQSAAPTDREALFWQSAQSRNRVEEYREYLKQFPDGTFAGLARARVAELEAQAKAPAKPPQVAAAPAKPEGPKLDNIEPIDREYRAREAARVRAAPDLSSKVVATLAEGDAVQVLGKVSGQNWLMVERPGGAPGYVALALLEDAAAFKRRKAEEEAQQRAAVTPPPVAAPPAPVPAPVAAAPARPEIGGLYRVTGTNPNGTRYSGTCRITRSGERYFFYWQVGSTYRGSGAFDGDELVIDWGQAQPVIYTVEDDGRLVGTWNGGNATEELERIN